MSATPDTTALDIAAASPAAMAHVATEGRWVTYEHLLKIDEYLLRVAAGEIDRLIIEAPIRHGKSELVSHYFPAWWLGTKPNDQVMLLAYGDTFARDWGRKARNTLAEVGPRVFGVRVSGSSAAADWWHIEGKVGTMFSAGLGGQITGKGANCVPGETMIATTRGAMRIDALIRMADRPQVLVASRGRAQYAQVTAARTTYADELYEITTDTGHRLRATGEHPIFVSGSGYIPSKDLRRGQCVLVTDTSPMREVRGGNGSSAPLSSLLSRIEEYCRRAYVRMVRDRRRQEGVRNTEGASPQLRGCLLFARMLKRASRRKEQASMRDVRRSCPAEDAEVLLRCMPSTTNTARAACLPEVPGIVSAEIKPHPILLPPMRKRDTCSTHAGSRKLALPRWAQLRKVVPRNAAADPRARQSQMCALRELGAPLGDSPYRRTSRELRCDKSSSPVCDLPCDTPQVKEAAIVGIERVRAPHIPVYDLEVAGPRCFFADGVLVHNCLIIDDPVKNAEEANSQVYRDKVWEWWQATSSSRLQPGGAVVLVMARWHEDDLAGRLQASKDGAPWTVLRLPALAEETDPLGRPMGAALCPEMFDEEALRKKKLEMGSYWFAALLQQKPAPAEGLMFKRADFRYWKGTGGDGDKPQVYELKGDGEDEKTRYISASTCIEFQTVDVAASEKTTADYTVVSTWAVTPSRELILLDVERQQFDALNVSGFLKRVSDKHDRPPMWIETFGAGRTPHKELMRAGYPVRELKVEQGSRSDKLVRAHVAWALYEAHKVYHPFGAAFLGDFEDELATFPSGRDDQVDTVSYAARLVPTIGAVHVVRQPLSKTIVGHGIEGGF